MSTATTRKPFLIYYETKRKPNRYGRAYADATVIERGLPFCIKRYLVHRVRLMDQHVNGNGKPRHRSCDMWCGSSGFPDRNEMTDRPSKSRLLCEACERKAVEAGEPTTQQIVGYHIHTGRMVTRQTCHLGEREAN